MKDIPGMEPVLEKEEKENETISREEEEKRKEEEKKLDQMVEVFYKPEYKVYIFKGEEMYNEEFLNALDASPTYSRTAQDLEKMMGIFCNKDILSQDATQAIGDIEEF
jgi:cell division protein FtsZ